MPAETAIEVAVRPDTRSRQIDWAVAALAERQHGVVSRTQLLSAGLGVRAVGRWLARGRLHPIHRGVYAVGHGVISSEARMLAAVLCAGPGAVLSHRSAAMLWRLTRTGHAIEVTVPRKLNSRPDLIRHHGRLPVDEITTLAGIPVTTVARTLLDLAAVAPRDRLERAVNEAEYRRLGGALSITDLVARHPRRRGVATLRAILTTSAIGTGITRSELEDGFLAFLRHNSLPSPEVNATVQLPDRTIEADCLWREHRLIVELDGRAAHDTTDRFERDRARDRALQVAGWRVVRVTWRQLHAQAAALAADLRRLLDPSPA